MLVIHPCPISLKLSFPVGLQVAALLAFVLGWYLQDLWAVVLLVVGILLVVTGLLPKITKGPDRPTSPAQHC